ncbi:hypothetical protein [Kitasatospora phosalacinea]|uniref:Uncharacterized protein n=1 Tax=Kitasatospora phosalacinea TaxID=2065 RepID=A0A9W6UUA6_9ACTN|nr:hypothetical protein [Kitasatospora phosalacinea]GLW59385.1 hypothetical protein Kpho01_73950 [Kitasatospora phosalacinea]
MPGRHHPERAGTGTAPEPPAPPAPRPPSGPSEPSGPSGPPQAHWWWARRLTRDVPEPTLLAIGLALATVAAGLAGACYSAFAFADLAEAGRRPEVRVTVSSCTAYTVKGRVPHEQIDCYGRSAAAPTGGPTDGPTGAAAEQWRLRGVGYRSPGEAVAVRCEDGGTCWPDLKAWLGAGTFSGGIALAILTVGGYRTGRLLTLRHAPGRAAFFTRRSTFLTLAALGTTSFLLVAGSLFTGLLSG